MDLKKIILNKKELAIKGMIIVVFFLYGFNHYSIFFIPLICLFK